MDSCANRIRILKFKLYNYYLYQRKLKEQEDIGTCSLSFIMTICTKENSKNRKIYRYLCVCVCARAHVLFQQCLLHYLLGDLSFCCFFLRMLFFAKLFVSYNLYSLYHVTHLCLTNSHVLLGPGVRSGYTQSVEQLQFRRTSVKFLYCPRQGPTTLRESTEVKGSICKLQPLERNNVLMEVSAENKFQLLPSLLTSYGIW